jgi:hypothetical protein
MTVGNAVGDKQYFVEMIDEVRSKLARLAADSPIKRCFPQSRLDAIRAKMEANTAEALEWARWQPLFLFLRNSGDAAIQAFDDDLRLVECRSTTNNSKIFEFLKSDSEDTQPWAGGIFEVYVKAAALRSTEVSNASLDWGLPNGRRPDLKVDFGARSICIECTSLGESRASDERWGQHIESVQTNCDETFFERQDAYTQSRRIYAKVFDKIAPQLDANRSQLNTDGPNVLLISLNAVTSYLAARSPAVGWALDELFATQPNGNDSPASLCEWLLRQRKQAQQPQPSMDDLLKALSRLSGIIVFDGCKLGAARINYNAGAVQRIAHAEMAIFEHLLSVPPLYAQ